MDLTQPVNQTANCFVCGELPDELTVNIGREHIFPAAFYKLIPVGTQNTIQGMFSQTYRCRDCGADFVWEEEPQMYGSGNNDQGHLLRVSELATVRNQVNSPPNDAVSGTKFTSAADVEASPAQHAFNIMEKHYARAGVVMKHQESPGDWSHFCLLFYLNTNELLKEGMLNAKLLRGILAELVDFIQAFSGKDFTNKLYYLLKDFDARYTWLAPFLPLSAQIKISEMEEMRLHYEDDDERFRLGQMSY